MTGGYIVGFKEKLENIVDPAVGPVFDMVCGLCLDGVAGAVVPGVGNMLLSYRQQRLEKNLEDFISQIVKRQDELNQRLEGLDPDKLNLIQEHYFGLVTDYVLVVKQKDKIDYIVNGFINIAGLKEPQEDVVLLFYDTLDLLNLLDIRILKMYYYPTISDDNYFTICDEYSIESSQYRMVQEKLFRLGLLDSKNEERLNNNIEELAEFLKGIESGKRNNKLKYKKVSTSDSYKITRYGSAFIRFFIAFKTLNEESINV
jgi:hypothetical protein